MSTYFIKIPYISQWSQDADDHSGDCGPTCVAMILAATGVNVAPDSVYRYMTKVPTEENRGYTGMGDLIEALRRAGRIGSQYYQYRDKGSAIDGLRKRLERGQPSIALVKYRPWRKKTGNLFNGGHFVVVSGYDSEGNVYVHDPLFGLWRPSEEGEYYKFSMAEFVSAWGGFSPKENPNYALVVCDLYLDFERDGNAYGDDSLSQSQELSDGRIKQIVSYAAHIGDLHPRLSNPHVRADYLERIEVSRWGESVIDHKVEPGDSLSYLADYYYGDGRHWRTIQKFNNMTDTILYVGQKISIPLYDLNTSGKMGIERPAVDLPHTEVWNSLSENGPRTDEKMEVGDRVLAKLVDSQVEDEETYSVGKIIDVVSHASGEPELVFRYEVSDRRGDLIDGVVTEVFDD